MFSVTKDCASFYRLKMGGDATGGELRDLRSNAISDEISTLFLPLLLMSKQKEICNAQTHSMENIGIKHNPGPKHSNVRPSISSHLRRLPRCDRSFSPPNMTHLVSKTESKASCDSRNIPRLLCKKRLGMQSHGKATNQLLVTGLDLVS